jgi:dipeptidyl aminopeptidase/acylaminoacyl peptidase
MIGRNAITAALLMLGCLLVSRPALAGTSTELRLEDVLSMKTFPEDLQLALTRDGQFVAYTLQDPLRREPARDIRYYFWSPTGVPEGFIGSDIWIANTRTNESKRITDGKGSSWGPAWSPDGEYLAFYSDKSGRAAVWMWDRSYGRLRQVSDEIVRPYEGFNRPSWTPDGKTLVTKVLPEGMPLDEAATLTMSAPKRRSSSSATVSVFESLALRDNDPQVGAWKGRYLAELALINVSSGKTRRIARGFQPRWYMISPDGAHIAFTTFKGWEDNSPQTLFDLGIVSISDGDTRVVASNIRQSFYGSSVSWSPDSRRLAYTTWGPKADGEAFITPINGGESRQASHSPHASLGHFLRAPIWDAEGEHLYCLASGSLWKISIADGQAAVLAGVQNETLVDVMPGWADQSKASAGHRSTYVKSRDDHTGEATLYKVNLRTGSTSKLFGAKKDCDYFNISSDGSTIVYLDQGAGTPPDIWCAHIDFGDRKQLTHVNPQFDEYAMGDSRVIEWLGIDGQILRGALLLPANFHQGSRYPLIVYPYPGYSPSNRANRFGLSYVGPGAENMQIFATRGYAVLLPDAPVRIGTPMRDFADAVVPGINKVIELGIADPEKLGLMGHSLGGYAMLGLLVQTSRFKAAIMRAGYGDMLTAYGQMSEDGSAVQIGLLEGDRTVGLGGSPWTVRDRYVENSPIFYLDRIQTPLLIVQGSLDILHPPYFTGQVFTGLRRLGKEAVYARYEGERHAEMDWSYANQMDFCQRVVNWFDRYLKPRVHQ